MKLKIILFISLLLFVMLTITDITASDTNLTESDNSLSAQNTSYEINKTITNNTIKTSNSISLFSYAYKEDYEGTNDFKFGEKILFRVYLPSSATNKLTLNVNKKTYNVNYNKGIGTLIVNTTGWNLGKYEVTAKYHGDSKNPSSTSKINIDITANVNYPPFISVGEDEYISIYAPNKQNGNANLYCNVYNQNDQLLQTFKANMTVRNGYGKYSLSNLPKGIYSFSIDYTIGNYQNNESSCYIQVIKNNDGFKSSVSPINTTYGKTITVTLNGPKINSNVRISVDEIEVKSLSLSKGKIKLTLPKLSIGNHKINIYIYKRNTFYSKTYYVTIKKENINIVLKSLKVKKSSKKLTLTAILKINNKTYKNKKLTFKFNKHTFKTKTNKNGVGKIIIKKNILKKLKIGKKIKYQVSYNTKTVKKTAKIKH